MSSVGYPMQIAPNKSALKRRLDRYLWLNNSSEIQLLRAALNANFKCFDRVAIIGGLVRDFAREGRSGFISDVDLVIDDSKEAVAQLAQRLKATPNRFGGYGYKSGLWKIDFWALETTWARQYLKIDNLDDILSCTFFDWDAVAYNLWERKLICSDDYLERLNSKILDINFRPNPSPMGNLVRTVRRLMLWQAEPGQKLTKFIEEHLDDNSLRLVQIKEKEIFNFQVSTSWNTAEEAKSALLLTSKQKTHQFELFKRDMRAP